MHSFLPQNPTLFQSWFLLLNLVILAKLHVPCIPKLHHIHITCRKTLPFFKDFESERK